MMNASGPRPGFKIAMDGAFCVGTGDGCMTIRKRSLRNLLVLAFLGPCLLGMVVALVASIGGLFQGEWSLEALLDICGLAAATGVIAVTVLVLILSLWSPSVRIDADRRVMEVSRGWSRRTVDFEAVSHIRLQGLGIHGSEGDRLAVIGVDVVLSDGSSVRLGTVSGQASVARPRAVRIAQLVGETMDVGWTTE
jgi:hypothetical protein